MKYNLLGNTGLLVSELCLGTMTFGGKNGGIWENIGDLQQKEVNELVKAAIAAGINFIDTANIYSFGQSELLLGQSLKDLGLNRDELIIATKVRGRMDDKPNGEGLSRYHIFNSVNDSLKRLQMDHIDILYVHGVDKLTPVEEIMHSLNDIVLSGKVRYIAVCNWPAWMVMQAQGIATLNGWNKFIGLQYFYSVAARDIEREIVPLAQDQNLSIMPWSPLAGGFISGKYTREKAKTGNSRRDVFDFPPINKEKAFDIVDVLKEISNQHHASVAEVALAWVRQQQGVTSTIIGAKNIEQLLDNIKSTTINLTAENLEAINAVSKLAEEYPGWMVNHQNGERM
ncbi:aldo/keto reductase [uncultured Bacteroides sp.]|uniref:aldo/keto reductase n=1 Tax=uncultured Bacteroides sp. TaxID=162156 RepID=UPI002AA70D48|nr:aldo/keto reductase [uncultured Bacteroides sp.]